jgi:hypothetical protein
MMWHVHLSADVDFGDKKRVFADINKNKQSLMGIVEYFWVYIG